MSALVNVTHYADFKVKAVCEVDEDCITGVRIKELYLAPENDKKGIENNLTCAIKIPIEALDKYDVLNIQEAALIEYLAMSSELNSDKNWEDFNQEVQQGEVNQ